MCWPRANRPACSTTTVAERRLGLDRTHEARRPRNAGGRHRGPHPARARRAARRSGYTPRSMRSRGPHAGTGLFPRRRLGGRQRRNPRLHRALRWRMRAAAGWSRWTIGLAPEHPFPAALWRMPWRRSPTSPLMPRTSASMAHGSASAATRRAPRSRRRPPRRSRASAARRSRCSC